LALPVLRWIIPALLTPAETGYGHFSLLQMVDILLHNFSTGLRPAAGIWPILPSVLLLGLGILPLFWDSDLVDWPPALGVLLLALYLAVPLGAVWLVSLWRPIFTDRYLIITLPAFYLMIASGVTVAARMAARAIDQRRSPAAQTYRARRIAATRAGSQAADQPVFLARDSSSQRAFVVAMAVLVALFVAASLPFVWAQAHNAYKADFRAATRFVTANASVDEPVMFLMPYAERGFNYYHPQPVATVEPPYTGGMTDAQVNEAMTKLTAGRRRVWLFLSEAEFWDPEALIPAWFESHGVRACRAVFAYIEVRCYDMPR
jgi:hypothetical protein